MRPTVHPGSKLKLVGGKLALVRFGPPTPQRQKHDSAPSRFGMYAFPAATGVEWYFCSHRWESLVPKRLRLSVITDVKDDEDRNQRWADRDAWIKANYRTFKPSTFWVDGPVFTRMNRNGEVIGHPDLDPGGWELLDVEEFVTAARKSVPGISYVNGPDGRINYSTDHLELFVPGRR